MTRRSGSRRRQLKASHQKNWLIGRHAVTETLTAGVWDVDELYLANELDPTERESLLKLAGNRVRVHLESADRITQLCHADHHQGVAARMAAFEYRTAETLEGESDDGLFVICDRIQDTHNFGAILRCCDALGAQAVIVGESGQSRVTPQVARSSAGAVNFVPIVLAESLLDCVLQLKNAGVKIVAGSEHSDSEVWSADLTGSVALIIGNEAEGIAQDLLEQCDTRVRVPMLGQVSSLNASVAAGILLYEISRQRS